MPTGRFLRVEASVSRICKAVLIVVVAAVFVGLGLRHPEIWLHMAGVVFVGACLGVAVIGRLDAWRSGRGKTPLVWPPPAKSLSENPGGSERNNRTGKVNHVQEVHLLFFPANEQAPKAIHP